MRWLACVLLAFLVATCGQKGPLTLPEEEAPRATRASGEFRFRAAWGSESTPVPYSVAGDSFGSGRWA